MDSVNSAPAFLDLLRTARATLTKDCGALRGVAKALGRNEAMFDELDVAIAEEEMSIVVVGEVNRGKSTFMNALLGARVFPPAATVCTAAVTRLRDGSPRAIVEQRDGTRRELTIGADPASQLREVVSRRNPDAQGLSAVDVWFPNRFARDGVVLLDTPGVNDPELWREQITVEAVARADAVVFLLDAHAVVTGTETSFLRQYIFGSLVSRVLFVVNKADQLTETERLKVSERCHEQLAKACPEPRIFLVSARQALLARTDGSGEGLATSGLLAFEAELDRMLGEERVQIHFESRAQRLRRERTNLAEDVQFRLGATHRGVEEIRRSVVAARERLGSLRATIQAEVAARRTALARVPDEVGREAARAFDGAADRRIRGSVAQREIAEVAASRSREDLRAHVLARIEEARREALQAIEADLHSRRDTIRLEAGAALGQLERRIDEARALVVPSVARAELTAIDLPLDIAEAGGGGGAAGVYITAGGVAAAVALVAGSGGLALLLLGAGVFAEVASSGTQAVRNRLNPTRLDAACEKVRDRLAADARAAARRFAERAVEVLDAEMKRRIADAQRSLDAVECQSALDTGRLEAERARLIELGAHLRTVEAAIHP